MSGPFVPISPPSTPSASFTSGVLNSEVAWLNQDLKNYSSALAAMFESVYGIVVSQGDPDQPATYVAGWQTLLDPSHCPTNLLPFLSQFCGVKVQPGTPDAVARNQIINNPAFARGTVNAMKQAALGNLVAVPPDVTPVITFLERTAANGSADPYHIVLIFRAAECPSVPLLISAVEAQKPAGIQITYQATNGFTWIQAQNTWSADTMTWAQSQFQQP